MKIEFKHTKWSNYLFLIVIAISVTSLFGWLFDIEAFKRIFPDSVAMNPLTASCFIMSAFSFWLLTLKKNNSFYNLGGHALALLILFIGLLVVLSNLIGFNTRIDQLLFSSKISDEPTSYAYNRMSPNTAFCFVLTAIELFMLHYETKKRFVPYQFIAILVSLGALLTMIGYLYDFTILSEMPSYVPMAIHTSANFFLMSVALLFAYPDKGIMSTYTSRSSGGKLSRTFLLPLIALPVLMGMLYNFVRSKDLVSSSLTTLFLVYGIVIGFAALIYLYSYSLNKKENQKRKVEANLKESNERFKSIFEYAPDPMWLFDMNSLFFLEVNQKAIIRYGYTLDEFRKMRITDIRPKDEVPKVQEKIEIIRKNEKLTGSWKHQLRNDKLIDVEITYHKLEMDGQEQCLEIAKDVTERIKIEKQIKELNKELEAFTFSVAHDLRAPLRVIDGYAGVLKEDFTPVLDKEGMRLISIIASNARQMGQLIDDLLNLSRIGRASLKYSMVDIQTLVSSIVDEQKILFSEYNTAFFIGNIISVYCDGVLIKSVLTNLIANAIKYSRNEENPKVEIGSYVRENEVVYFVKDNGVGFDMNYADKLFGVFQRLHKATEFEGTGVGLAIVQRIVLKHDGHVWANAIKDEGATFYFSLPINYKND